MKLRYLTPLIVILLLTFYYWRIREKAGNEIPPSPETPEPTVIPTPQFKEYFSSQFQPESLSYTPRAPQYQLPLEITTIENLNEFFEYIPLSEDSVNNIRQYGFTIITYPGGDDIIEACRDITSMGIPLYVTVDTVLHTYHILFDNTLQQIEEERFYKLLEDLTESMLSSMISEYDTARDTKIKEATRRNIAFFGVAMSLLDPSYKPPGYVKDEVAGELELIEEHAGFTPSPIFHYREDYSQYVPRGHYTRSEKLERYFKCMMWYGRMAFLLKGCDECFVSKEDAEIATIQAVMISNKLHQVDVKGRMAIDVWLEIYQVTSFMVGYADDLTPVEYQQAVESLYNGNFTVEMLASREVLLRIKAVLAQMRNPEIYGGTGRCSVEPPITEEKLDECLSKSKGMRFMGQRYVPDSYVFQRLVAPSVGLYFGGGKPFTMEYTALGPARVFPRGLDFMAVLGSDLALEILEDEGDTEYERYMDKMLELRSEFSSLSWTDWHRNLYWSWIYSLQPLLEEYGDGYPTYMQTKMWSRRLLQAALASWVELRHDTILYAKQSYTPELTAVPPKPELAGYVEPIPELYKRLSDLAKMTGEGLRRMNIINETVYAKFKSLADLLDRLTEISVKELESEELSPEDYRFIEALPDMLESIYTGYEAETLKTTLVADVHTDINTGTVLEEAVGYIDLLIVVVKFPDGKIMLAAGPALSYYEFKHPLSNRLTDEAWREMIDQNPPERPRWISTLISE